MSGEYPLCHRCIKSPNNCMCPDEWEIKKQKLKSQNSKAVGKTIYLAGKVTGEPWEAVVSKFEKAHDALNNEFPGCVVFNPVEHVQVNCLQNETWEDIMKLCLKKMMECDEVHLLPCWQESRGAKLERDVAVRLGMEVVYR